MDNNVKTPRYAAVLSLNSSFKSGKFVNLELDSTIKKYGFTDKDKSFYTRLLYGTVERKITIMHHSAAAGLLQHADKALTAPATRVLQTCGRQITECTYH